VVRQGLWSAKPLCDIGLRITPDGRAPLIQFRSERMYEESELIIFELVRSGHGRRDAALRPDRTAIKKPGYWRDLSNAPTCHSNSSKAPTELGRTG
jgi:hypothetical protein